MRLTGCDLRCRWCDTAHAFTGGRSLTVEQVVDEVDRLNCPLVEITGGEPLLQPSVHALMRALLERGNDVLLETGGHHDITGVDPRVVRIVDLKAPGSGESERNHLPNLDALRPHDEVKIVIADRVDYEWARDVVRRKQLHERAQILLSPVHGEIEPRKLATWILEDRLPVRMQLQLHKFIWGADARGV